MVQRPLTLPFTFSRHVGAASSTSSAGNITDSRHVGRDQDCGALDPPADVGASSAQLLVHPQLDQRRGHGLYTTCIEPRGFMARPQDFAVQLDFIARRDFIYSVYSVRPDAVPSPSPDARHHFDRPLSCFYEKNIRNQFLLALPAHIRFFKIPWSVTYYIMTLV